MAAQADGSVVIITEMDTEPVAKGVAKIKSQMNGLSNTVAKIGGLIASAFAVREIVQFGKECIELGSNVAEVQNVVDVAFGDMAYKIENFADTAIQNFGMSELAAKKTASTYMAMARGMGIQEEAASNMAITLTGLTGDIASFYNISQELADIKLKSVFTGETETLKDLGIVMTQANLQAYAMERGITKSVSSMTQAEAVALRYNFVIDQLSLASGDFARTSNSWANQTRILSMQWQEFMSIIGNALTAVLTPLVRVLNQIVSSMIAVANTISTVITTLFGGADKQIQQTTSNAASVGEAIGGSVDQQNALTDATKETAKEQKKAIAGFDEINKLAGPGTSGGGSASAGGGAALDIPALEVMAAEQSAGVLVDKLTRVMELIAPLAEAFRPIAEGIKETFSMVFSDIWELVIYPSVMQWVEQIGPAMFEFVVKVGETLAVLFDEVKKTFDMLWLEGVTPALALIQQIWSDMWSSLVEKWNQYGAPIFDRIKLAIQNVGEFFRKVWTTILKPIWDTVIASLTQLWNEHLKPLWDNLLIMFGEIILAGLDIFNEFIVPIVNGFVDLFGPTISDIISVAVEVITHFAGVLANILNLAITIFTELVQFVRTVFTSGWRSAFRAVANIVIGIINSVINAFEKFVNFVIDGINKIIETAKSAAAAIGVHLNIPNVPKFSLDRIPMLAQGAVIPPNREFMAILGDQKSGNNIETPEALLRQIVREEGGGNGDTTVILEIDREQFGRLVYKYNKSESRRIGVQLVEV